MYFIMSCRYATPFGLTSEYAHPAEILFLGFATIIGPAITGPHLMTLWLWMVLRVLETVEAHCGYHFPWSLSNFLPLYGGWVLQTFSLTTDMWVILFYVHKFIVLKLYPDFQSWFSWLSPPFAVHQVWKLLINLYLHGLVGIGHILLTTSVFLLMVCFMMIWLYVGFPWMENKHFLLRRFPWGDALDVPPVNTDNVFFFFWSVVLGYSEPILVTEGWRHWRTESLKTIASKRNSDRQIDWGTSGRWENGFPFKGILENLCPIIA